MDKLPFNMFCFRSLKRWCLKYIDLPAICNTMTKWLQIKTVQQLLDQWKEFCINGKHFVECTTWSFFVKSLTNKFDSKPKKKITQATYTTKYTICAPWKWYNIYLRYLLWKKVYFFKYKTSKKKTKR